MLIARFGVRPRLQQHQRQLRRIDFRRQVQRRIPQPIAKGDIGTGHQQQPYLLLTPRQDCRCQRRSTGHRIARVQRHSVCQQQSKILRVLHRSGGMQRAIAIQARSGRIGPQRQQRA
ncbi:hypothetical protein D3C71_1625450 [compost metagenome]